MRRRRRAAGEAVREHLGAACVLRADLAAGEIDPGLYAELGERLAARLEALPETQGRTTAVAEHGAGRREGFLLPASWRLRSSRPWVSALPGDADRQRLPRSRPGPCSAGSSGLDAGGGEVNRGNARAAVASYRSAVAALPARVDLRTRFALALARSGRRQEAVTQLRFAVRKAPRDAEARLFLGAVLVAAGRDREAVGHWRRFLVLSPTGAASTSVRRRLRALQRSSGDRR